MPNARLPVSLMRPPLAFRATMTTPGALASLIVLLAAAFVGFLAFRANSGALLGSGFTTDNLADAVLDPLNWTIMLRSVAIAGTVTIATVVAAFPVAHYLAFHAGDKRALILFLVSLPFWTSYLLRVFAWKIVLAYNGVLNSALVGTGLLDQPSLVFLNTPAAVVVTLAHAYAPFAVLPIYVALAAIPRSLMEAAEDLGAGPWTTFLRVILPNAMPGVLAAALIVFVPTVGDYVTPALVGGPSSTMIGSMIQAQFGKANDWPFGAALAIAVLMVVLSLVLIARAADRRFGSRA